MPSLVQRPEREALRSQEAIGLVRGRAKKGLAEFAGILEELEAWQAPPAYVNADPELSEIDRQSRLLHLDSTRSLFSAILEPSVPE